MIPTTGWLAEIDNKGADVIHHALPVEHVATYHDGGVGSIVSEQVLDQVGFLIGDSTAVVVGGLNAAQLATMEARLGITGVFGAPMVDFTASPVGWASCGDSPATAWNACAPADDDDDDDDGGGILT